MTARAVSVLLSLVTGIVVARAFGAGGKGTLAYLVTVTNLAARSSSLGIESSFTRLHDVRKLPVHVAAGCVVWTTLALGAAGAVLLNLGYTLMPGAAAGIPPVLVRAYAWGMPALLLLFVLSYLMFGLRRELAYTGIDIAWRVGVLIVTVAAARAAHRDIVIVGLLQLAVAVIVAVGALWMLWRAAGGRLVWRRTVARAMIGDASGVYVYNTIRYGLAYGGMMIAAQWFGVAEAGVFSVALGLAEAVTLVAGSVNLAFYPSVAVSTRPAAYTLRMVWRVMALCAAIGSALFLVSSWLVPVLYGPAFTGAVPLFGLLLPGVVLLAGEQVIASLLVAAGRIRAGIAAVSAGAVVLLVLAGVLNAQEGIHGLALACSVAQATAAIVMFTAFWSQRRTLNAPLA